MFESPGLPRPILRSLASTWGCAVLVVAIGLAGCNSQAPPGEARPAGGSSAAPVEPAATGSETPAVASGSPARDPRTQWIGDIPYDVFFDRPLDVYRDSTPVADSGAAPATTTDSQTPAPAVAATSPASQPELPPAGNAPPVDWARIVPIEVLVDETKQLRNTLAGKLRTVGTYNAAFQEITTDGSVLAVVAALVERHPQHANWQDKARYVRALAYDIYLNANAPGRGQFEKTTEPFEKIITMLDGGPPPAMQAEEHAAFGDVGDRAEMMKHIEARFNWLKSELISESRLQEEQERAIHEASMLAALGTVMTDAGFDFADHEDYQSFMRALIEGSAAAAEAARAGNFANLDAARNRIQNSCTPCHSKYRTGDSSF